MFFISLSNNREYISKQKFNKYINLYPYYLLTYLIRLQTKYHNFYVNSATINNLLGMNCINFLCLTIKVINKIDLRNNIILYFFYLFSL